MRKILKIIYKAYLSLRYDRIVFFKDTPEKAKKFFNTLTRIHNNEFNERLSYNKITLSNNLLSKGYDYIKINEIDNNNYKLLNAINSLRKDYSKINWEEKSKNAKKAHLITKKIEDMENLRIIVNYIIDHITSYIGSLPILDTYEYWFSPNKDNYNKTSQVFHMDHEDIKMVRVLIPIYNVSINHGPIKIIDAHTSEKIYKKLYKDKIIFRRNTKVDDEIINQAYKEIEIKPIIIDNNSLAMIDTSRCYHYGSRMSKYPRELISLCFTSAFSVKTPIFFRKYNINNNWTRKENLIFGLKKTF